MKKISLLLTTLFFLSVIAVFAQGTNEILKSKTKSNQSNDRIKEQNAAECTAKVRCEDGSCTISFMQEVVSPRDAASGLPTGKRMHKPFVITKELDKSSPMVVRESPTKQSTGKVSVSDLSVMIVVDGKSRKLPVVNDQITLPSDINDNDCDLVVSWSWGVSNSGSGSTGTAGNGMTKRYEATFNLSVENGEYMASKHTKTGHVTILK